MTLCMTWKFRSSKNQSSRKQFRSVLLLPSSWNTRLSISVSIIDLPVIPLYSGVCTHVQLHPVATKYGPMMPWPVLLVFLGEMVPFICIRFFSTWKTTIQCRLQQVVINWMHQTTSKFWIKTWSSLALNRTRV